MTIGDIILRRARKLPPGTVFSPAAFADLGTSYAIGMALARLVNAAHAGGKAVLPLKIGPWETRLVVVSAR